MTDSRAFRAHCRLLRLATLTVLAGLGLMLAVGAVGAPWLLGMRFELDDGSHRLLTLVAALPTLGYLWALWAVQHALGELATGARFQPALAGAMRRMGYGVLAGALLSVFAVINLSRWIIGGGGSYVYFDLSAIVLGVVGAALILLARVVDQARTLQAELDEII